MSRGASGKTKANTGQDKVEELDGAEIVLNGQVVSRDFLNDPCKGYRVSVRVS
jgi:hypothetical protein